MEMTKLSAKNLGSLALPGSCPRCFWIKMNKKIPWQIFPGIFSSIDSYSKKITRAFVDATGKLPPWFSEEAAIIKPPSRTTFNKAYEDLGVLLTGAVDELLQLVTTSNYWIVDYKTAKYTANQDKLHMMYHTQLNGYAEIVESLPELGEVEKLSLFYYEPVTDLPDGLVDRAWTSTEGGKGFVMPFTPHVLEIERDKEGFQKLLERAAKLIHGECPAHNAYCPECEKLQDIVTAITQGEVGV